MLDYKLLKYTDKIMQSNNYIISISDPQEKKNIKHLQSFRQKKQSCSKEILRELHNLQTYPLWVIHSHRNVLTQRACSCKALHQYSGQTCPLHLAGCGRRREGVGNYWLNIERLLKGLTLGEPPTARHVCRVIYSEFTWDRNPILMNLKRLLQEQAA